MMKIKIKFKTEESSARRLDLETQTWPIVTVADNQNFKRKVESVNYDGCHKLFFFPAKMMPRNFHK